MLFVGALAISPWVAPVGYAVVLGASSVFTFATTARASVQLNGERSTDGSAGESVTAA